MLSTIKRLQMNKNELTVFKAPYVSALSIFIILGLFVFLNELIPTVFKTILIVLLIATLILGYLDEIVVSHSMVTIRNILGFTKKRIPIRSVEMVSIYKGLSPSTGFVFTINYALDNRQKKQRFEVHYQSEKVIDFLVFLLKNNICLKTGHSYDAKLYLNKAKEILRKPD